MRASSEMPEKESVTPLVRAGCPDHPRKKFVLDGKEVRWVIDVLGRVDDVYVFTCPRNKGHQVIKNPGDLERWTLRSTGAQIMYFCSELDPIDIEEAAKIATTLGSMNSDGEIDFGLMPPESVMPTLTTELGLPHSPLI